MDNHSTGPGEITPDGCAVDFYALVPPAGEAAIVHGAVPAGASVLELGCGTGRILRPLATLGHPVLGSTSPPGCWPGSPACRPCGRGSRTSTWGGSSGACCDVHRAGPLLSITV